MAHKLSDLVDPAKLQTLADLCYNATGIPVSLTDPDGSVVAVSGRGQTCEDLLRLLPDSLREPGRGDRSFSLWAKTGRKWVTKKCGNGLWEGSLPLRVLGDDVGYFVAGPFFKKPFNPALLEEQAKRLALDPSTCLKAASLVPVVDRAKVEGLLKCFSGLLEVLGEAALHITNFRPARVQRQKEETDRLEENILANMKKLVLPHVERLKKSGVTPPQMAVVEMIEARLKKVTSPVIGELENYGLSPRQSAVAALIKEGRTTKEIAHLLGISLRAVEFHRYNLRKKMGIDHKKTNLKALLLSLS